MKLLLDQNLSYRIVAAIADLYPGSAHVRDFGLDRADDAAVWSFAKERGFTIVSKDDDFRQRAFLFGHPPKVVWLRVGNCPTSAIVTMVRNHAEDIAAFLVDESAAFLLLAPGP